MVREAFAGMGVVTGIQRSGEAGKGNSTVNGGEKDGGGYIVFSRGKPEVRGFHSDWDL